MRGEETFDGKISGNRQLVDRYNEAKGKKPAKGQKKPKETGGESGGARSVAGHDESIRAIVDEHGPAHSSHILDRGEGHPDGRFHVVTHHEDGHVHHADHEDLESVHDHLAAAHGGEGEDSEHFGDMNPDDEELSSQRSQNETLGGGSSGTRRIGALSS